MRPRFAHTDCSLYSYPQVCLSETLRQEFHVLRVYLQPASRLTMYYARAGATTAEHVREKLLRSGTHLVKSFVAADMHNSTVHVLSRHPRALQERQGAHAATMQGTATPISILDYDTGHCNRNSRTER